MFGQQLMVTDDVLKLGYASVTFVDPRVKIDGTRLGFLTTVAACHTPCLRQFIFSSQ